MRTTITLPAPSGELVDHALGPPGQWTRPEGPARSRRAFAAAHVVADPLGDNAPGKPAVVDWDHTLAFRRHLWSWGLGVAEAMDTAQRGMGIDWDATRELITRSSDLARQVGGDIAAGAGTDHVPADLGSLDEVAAAYEQQVAHVEEAGAQVILMASRQLARVAGGPEDYHEVYGRILAQVRQPVILHWLGEMFDPALAGYWGSTDLAAATETVVTLVHEHAHRIDGIKVSLLDAAHEVALRRALPDGVRLYTGDDFNYPELIRGDVHGHSDALLGAFAAVAPAAATALHALDAGDLERYDRLMDSTLALSRHVFSPPTSYYKTGIAFLAWLAGHQPGFTMIGGLHAGRSVPHLVALFRLADDAGLLPDPELAATRMRTYLAVAGVA